MGSLAGAQTVWETVLHRRRLSGSVLHVTDVLGNCLAPSQTVFESLVGSQTVLAPSQTVWESPAGALTVVETVWRRLRLSWSLLLVLRRSWHRLKLSWSLQQVPRQSGRIGHNAYNVFTIAVIFHDVFSAEDIVEFGCVIYASRSTASNCIVLSVTSILSGVASLFLLRNLLAFGFFLAKRTMCLL
ncbi:hypothetical protein DPMN_025610 [Dreissena polymorpha]|uniref:Uncharacterized protein n=1 Tax=Dreissena polymorpha TaxID=45954 RepID=A0A9D4LPL9_DREPO|nr:hypothetical protein DPMN_025610 [Dreissena polymorpha]